jgi:diacylglycerol kinase family enzyme
VNPAAGGGRGRKRLEELIHGARLEVTGVRISDVRTRGGGPPRLNATADAVIAVGGDGTVRTVATALLDAGRDVPLGVVPWGTGNAFAYSLGVGTVEAALRAIRAGSYRRVEAARGRGEYPRLMRGHRTGLIHSAWRQAELESTTPIQIDGDPYPAGPLRARMDAGALRVLTPVMP